MATAGSFEYTLRPAGPLGTADDLGHLPYPVCRVLACWFAVASSALIWGSGERLHAAQLLWHEARLDSEGKLLSWVETGAPYDRIIRNAWEAFKNIPVQPDGYRTYFTRS